MTGYAGVLSTQYSVLSTQYSVLRIPHGRSRCGPESLVNLDVACSVGLDFE